MSAWRSGLTKQSGRAAQDESTALLTRLRARLAVCRTNAEALRSQLMKIADTTDRLAQEMDFGLLFDPRRRLLSVGYEVRAGKNRTVLLRPDGLGGQNRFVYRHRQE